MSKDAYADYNRHKWDKEINNKTCKIWNESSNEFIECEWKDIEVGNILMLTNEDEVPADCVLIKSSSETCYLETSSLDGEDNLKVKQPLGEIASLFNGHSALAAMGALHYLDDALVKTEQSNDKLHSFAGSIKLRSNPRSIQISLENVVLRGSKLKNTEWVISLVLMTGADTKLMQNTLNGKSKKSRIEKILNKYLFFSFLFMMLLSIICFIVSLVFSFDSNSFSHQFKNSESFSSLMILSYFILFNRFIPISLYVTIDILKLFQAKFLNWDNFLLCEERSTRPVVKSFDLIQELGQVEYVFADKTGTLTYNQMDFKKCSIKGKLFDSLEQLKDHERTSDICDFLEVLALCHTVIPEEQEGVTIYEAASQDEEALVQAARVLGYKFVSNSSGYYVVNVDNENLEYRVLGINELTSERKRMSVLVEPMSDRARGPVLYCKGADSVMLSRCNMRSADFDSTLAHIEHFAVCGFRTLLLAKKELSPAKAEEFSKKFMTAKNALYDKNKRLEEIAEEIEQDLQIVGVTAIEDKVHEGVSETIGNLMRSGIKVCILTGDKCETALNIAFSTKLFNPNIALVNVKGKNSTEVENSLVAGLTKHLFYSSKASNFNNREDFNRIQPVSSFDRILSVSVVKQKKEKIVIKPLPRRRVKYLNLGLVVDGEAFAVVAASKQLTSYLMMLISVSQSAIFGRVSAQQKSQIVKLVKTGFVFTPCTLAIGDGANDLSMLQEADIGVGILGKEGSQAANSSDFAIGKFQLLDKLMLFQGRWNYHRTSKVIFYSFYKNFVFSLPLFYYSFYSGYSATGLYESILTAVYNIIFTSLPILILGCFDKDMPRARVVKYPPSYLSGVYNRSFDYVQSALWATKALVNSLIVFFFAITASYSVTSKGRTEDLFILGTTVYISIVVTVNLILLFEAHEWSVLFFLSIFFSFGVLFPFLLIYQKSNLVSSAYNMHKIMDILNNFYTFIISTILGIILCVCLNLLATAIFNKVNKKHNKENFHTLYEDSETNKLMVKRAVHYRKDLPSISRSETKKTDSNGEEIDSYKFYKYSLKFILPYIERSYLLVNTERNVLYMKRLFRFSVIVYVFWTVLELSLIDQIREGLIFRVMIFVYFLAGAVLTMFKVFQKHYKTFIVIFNAMLLALKLVYESSFSSDGSLSYALLMPLLFFYLYNCTYGLFFPCIIYLLAHFIKQASLATSSSFWLLIHEISILFPLFIMCVFIGYTLEKCSRQDFILNKRLDYKFQKGHDILGNLLPGFVKERVKQGVRYIADYQSCVTVLFCDICDFDKICASHLPNELLELLDRFFGILDQLCDKHGVTKIETVNKTYMVCGGLKDSEEQIPLAILSTHHAVRCLDLGLEIIERVQQVYLKTGEKLQVKIGITTGPVIAGVVGEHKPQFSLVGDTVNTASRMCTTLESPDCIQISESTHKFVYKSKYRMTENMVFVKGKGNTRTFIVSSVGKRTRNRRMATIEKFNDENIYDRTSLEIQASEVEDLVEVEKFPQSAKLKLDDFKGNDEDIDMDLIGPVQWIVCSLYESAAQNQFRVGMIEMPGRHLKLGIKIFTYCYLLINSLFIIYFLIHSQTFTEMLVVFRLLFMAMIVTCLLFFEKIYKNNLYPWLVVSIFLLGNFIVTCSIQLKSDEDLGSIVLEKMYLFTLFCHFHGLVFGFTLTTGLLDLGTFYMVVGSSPHSLTVKLYSVFTLSLYYIIDLICCLSIEMQERKVFNINKFALKEIKNTEKLLNQMIPTQVLRNLHKDITTTDRYFDVTIIYADICGFTSWSSTKEPIEVVSMLSKLFSNFDHLCVRHNVYKVHTIGDCYVILSFTDGEQRDIAKECINMVEIALDMIKTIQKVNKRQKTELNMRIGMHTGEVIAGITGTNIVRYDIYGSDVEIANKTESSGLPGKINVSEVTQNLLEIYQPDRFEFTFNKEICHKPTGRQLNCYFLSQSSS
jgi:phospholipid-transporting ATPase